MTELATGHDMPHGTPRTLLIVGHRGARGTAPENTLASFAAALVADVDSIELDLHLSRDGELVIMHDACLERTTDGSGKVEEHTLAQLKKLNAAARWAPGDGYGVQRIPTLQEVFDLVRGRARLFLEIKVRADGTRYPGIEEKMLEAVRRNGAIGSALVSSFNDPSLARVRALEPSFLTQAIVWPGYLAQIACGAPQAVAADLHARGYRWAAVDKDCLTPELCATLRATGFIVHVYLVNSVTDLWRFAEMGVDVATTDYPGLLVPAYRQAMKAESR